MDTANHNALDVRAVGKEYRGQPVLADISFSVGAGRVTAILGRSGLGKSTLLDIIAGLGAPSAGNVSGAGRIAYVPQQDLLLPWRTAAENALLGVEIQRDDVLRAGRTLGELVTCFGIRDAAHRYPNELSGGERQKTSLIRAMLSDADTVLLDEPFAAIDFDSRLALAQVVRCWVVAGRRRAVLVTHHIDEAMHIADDVLVLSGRPATIALRRAMPWDELPKRVQVPLGDGEREILSLRRRPEFAELFEELWRAMSAEA